MSVERGNGFSPKNNEGLRPVEGSRYGVTYDVYTQLEDVGFYGAKVAEARESKELNDKVILVVGANNRGIGGAVMREAALQGAHVIGSSRTPWHKSQEVRDLVYEVTDLQSENTVMWSPADITKKDSRDWLIEDTVKRYGRIDGLVIAPAERLDKLFTEYSEEELRRLYEVNYWGPLLLMQSALKQMEEQNGGKIVVISSLAGAESAGQTPYASAKASLDNVVRSIPNEYFRYRGKIAVNALAIGLVDTQLTDDLSEKQKTRVINMSGSTRSLVPAEPAEAIAHLLNPNTNANGKVVTMVGRGEMPQLNDHKMIER